MTHYYLKDDLGQSMHRVFNPFEKEFTDRGAPEALALFHAGMPTGAIGYLVSAQTMAAMPSLASLGQWTPIDDITTVKWGLLIGHTDAWETHDVPKP